MRAEWRLVAVRAKTATPGAAAIFDFSLIGRLLSFARCDAAIARRPVSRIRFLGPRDMSDGARLRFVFPRDRRPFTAPRQLSVAARGQMSADRARQFFRPTGANRLDNGGVVDARPLNVIALDRIGMNRLGLEQDRLVPARQKFTAGER